MAYQHWGDGMPFSARRDLRGRAGRIARPFVADERSRRPQDPAFTPFADCPADRPDPLVRDALSRWHAERRARLEPDLKLDTWSAIRGRLRRPDA